MGQSESEARKGLIIQKKMVESVEEKLSEFKGRRESWILESRIEICSIFVVTKSEWVMDMDNYSGLGLIVNRIYFEDI